MITPTFTTERRLRARYQRIAGVDEVGRAPLAGPVVAAAVMFDPAKIGAYRSKHKWWTGIRDSKTLSASRRAALVDFIKENAYAFGIGQASHAEIDELHIHYASLLAMRRALEQMKLSADLVLVDGLYLIPSIAIEQQAIVDGDARVLSIAAASILAKVHRDELMRNYGEAFPVYGFAAHKGYDTDFHRKALRQNGPCEIHRMSFSTVRDIMNERFPKLMKV